MLVPLMGGIYEVLSRDGFMWHDVHTKFHDDWFRHFSNITVIIGYSGCQPLRQSVLHTNIFSSIVSLSYREEGFFEHRKRHSS
jgi:hypothetical protein